MHPHDYGLVKVCYTVNETLSLLSIGRTSLYELVKRGDLPASKFGKKTLFYASDIAELLTRLREQSRTKAPEDMANTSVPSGSPSAAREASP
jgi:excisionase family DNA binding protein